MKKGILTSITSLFMATALISSLASCKQTDEEIVYRNTYTVFFEANGGSGEMADQTFYAGKAQALSTNNFTAPAQSGKVFGGWSKSASSSEIVYQNGATITLDTNLRLFAVWVSKEGDGTGAETKGWSNVLASGQTFKDYDFYKNYVDEDTKPGDDFYQYSLGKNIKANFTITTEQDRINDKLSTFKKYVVEEYDSAILTTVRTKYNDLGNDDAKKAILQNHINDITNATDDELIEIAAQTLVYGQSFFTPKIGYDGRDPMITMGLAERYQDLTSYLMGGTVESVEQIVKAYNNGFKEEYRSAKVAAIKEILGNETETNAAACIDSLNTIIPNLEKDRGIDPSTNSSHNENQWAFSANDTSVHSLPVHAEIFNNLIAFKNTGEMDITTTNVKNFIKLTYLIYAYDFLFVDDPTKYSYPTALYNYLPFRFIQQKAFKEKYDSNGEAKTYINTMCEDFREKFIERLQNNTWMSKNTKAKAIEKAKNIIFFVGYANDLNKPTLFWETNAPTTEGYLDLLFELNRIAIIEYAKLVPASISDYETKREVFCYNASTTYDLLQMNAFYKDTINGVYILPIWLTEPGTNVNYTDAYNYGNFGVTLGHELCHAFDSDGAKTDENGNSTDWWAITDKLRYEEKKTQMTQLFNQCTAKTGNPVDGTKTLAENMADFGGITTAYDLFVSKKVKEGFAGEELKNQKKMFFQSYTFFYESNATDEQINNLMVVDTHSPFTVRVNANVSLVDDWYEVYGVEKGDKNYLDPNQRVILW